MSDRERVVTLLNTLLARRKKPVACEITMETALYTKGLDLDSLEAAELSAMLETELGRDPYTDGKLPETVGDIVTYYEQTAA